MKDGRGIPKPDALRLEALTAFYAGESYDRVAKRLPVSIAAMRNWRRDRPMLDATARKAGAEVRAERSAASEAATAKAKADQEAAMDGIRLRNEAALAQMSQRDREVCTAFVEGDTLQVIGDRHGITRERVRQIVLRWRVRGLEIPPERDSPLTDAQMRHLTKYVPGRRRGRPRKDRTPKLLPEEQAWLGMVGLEFESEARKPKRNLSLSPERREWLTEHMRKVGLSRRGQGKHQLAAKEEGS